MSETQFRYFSPIAGHAFKRPGTSTFIGATLVKGKGFVINPDAVVAIPSAEVSKYLKDYNNGKRREEIRELTLADFEAYQAARLSARRSRETKAAPANDGNADGKKPKK
jgi:acyl CoA:acetate/3-ketoacid CoA transferase beta subunit